MVNIEFFTKGGEKKEKSIHLNIGIFNTAIWYIHITLKHQFFTIILYRGEIVDPEHVLLYYWYFD